MTAKFVTVFSNPTCTLLRESTKEYIPRKVLYSRMLLSL
jgi:hypothetical protein